MTFLRFGAAARGFTLACLIAAASVATAQSSLVLDDVAIVDIEAGTVTQRQSVFIEDGTIREGGPNGAAAPATVRLINGAGGYLIPGLWDSHVHIFSTPTEPETALPLLPINGITGVRDMGALWPIDQQQTLAAQIAAGDVLGPRLILSGAWVDASPGSWPGMFLADTPDQARDVVDQIATTCSGLQTSGARPAIIGLKLPRLIATIDGV